MSILSEREQKEFRDLDNRISSRKVYDWAKSEGKLKEVDIEYRLIFDIKKGQYLVLSQEMFPSYQHEVRRWVELMEKDGDTGYCSWDYFGRNHPCPFVIGKNVPEEFQGYVAIHEIFEGEVLPIATSSYQDHRYSAAEEGVDIELTPPEIDAHRFACEVELMNVFLGGEKFSLRYISWVPDAYFENADPDFLKKYQRDNMSPLELTVNFLRVISGSERKWVEKYAWLKEKFKSSPSISIK